MRYATACLMSIVLTALTGMASAFAAPPGVNMLPNFETTATHRFDYAVTSTLTMSAFGNDQTTESSMQAQIELELLDEPAVSGGHVLGLTYQSMKISFDGGQVPGSFNSQQPVSADAGNVYAQICRPLLGKQVRLTIDQAGAIQSIDGLSELAPDGLAGVLFEQLFGESAAKAMFQPLLQAVPSAEQARHRPSDSWQLERPAIESLGVAASEVTLTMLRGDNPRDIALIEVSGKTKPIMPGEAAVLPNIEIRKSELQGRLHWNGQYGVLESLETEATSEMQSSAQGITISVESVSTTRVKRLK